MEERPKKENPWAWFLVPLVLLAVAAAALYLFGEGGPFAGGSGYDVR